MTDGVIIHRRHRVSFLASYFQCRRLSPSPVVNCRVLFRRGTAQHPLMRSHSRTSPRRHADGVLFQRRPRDPRRPQLCWLLAVCSPLPHLRTASVVGIRISKVTCSSIVSAVVFLQLSRCRCSLYNSMYAAVDWKSPGLLRQRDRSGHRVYWIYVCKASLRVRLASGELKYALKRIVHAAKRTRPRLKRNPSHA